MAYAKTVLNRRNYRPKRVVRAKKNLKQLVVLALHAASSSALSFNQIQAVLKRSLKLHVSNFVLKRTLHQLRESGHVARSNGQYVSTGKRLQHNRNTKKLLSRKARKRVMKLAFRARKDVKKQVSGVLRARNAVLEKLILKSIRALKRQHKSEGRRGFYFQSIKAMVKQLAKHKGKKLRNIVIVKALESLRASGKVVLKRGKNYLTKSGTSKNVAKPKQTRKRNKSSKKLRRPKKMAKRKKKSRTTKGPKSHGEKVSSFVKSEDSSEPKESESKTSDLSDQVKSVISRNSSRFTDDLIRKSLFEAQNEAELSSS